MTARGTRGGRRGLWRRGVLSLWLATIACGRPADAVLTFSGSAVGREGDVLRVQLDRFAREHPEWPVTLRVTPDAADLRRQLYVQWLNGRAADPDVLQIDVVWTAEFAAAGWILDLGPLGFPAAGGPRSSAGDAQGDLIPEAFFPAALGAGRWAGRTFALPWFVDVGLLYWRTDLLDAVPADLRALTARADRVRRERGLPYGLVWQGARYEGLVTVFLEHLGAFGGHILDGEGRVRVDEEPAVRALTFMRDAIHAQGVVPADVLAWQEEQVRFAFQNGQAVLMRNWPYAAVLLRDPATSRVAGGFDVAAFPAADGGRPTAALGGSLLAVNANSDQPEAAYELIRFLLDPNQMRERAELTGQYPSRSALYEDDALANAFGLPPARVRQVIEHAEARPATPVYAELSSILQVHLHRALSRQVEPREALTTAAREIRILLSKTGLAGADAPGPDTPVVGSRP
jgi:multiple sugar transport system substrate-binding protein